MNVPGIVFVIWWILLLATIFVVVPLLIFLLHRTLRAARNIERYLAEMREAGEAIAANTGHIRTLEETIGLMTPALDVSAQLRDHSAALAAVLGQRANGTTDGVK